MYRVKPSCTSSPVSKHYHDTRDLAHLLEGLGGQVNALANQILGRHGLLLVARLGGIEAHAAMERARIALARSRTSTRTGIALLRRSNSTTGAGSILAAAGAVGRTIHVHSGDTLESRVVGAALVRRHLDQSAVGACYLRVCQSRKPAPIGWDKLIIEFSETQEKRNEDCSWEEWGEGECVRSRKDRDRV